MVGFGDPAAVGKGLEAVLSGQAVRGLHVVEQQQDVSDVEYGGFNFHGSCIFCGVIGKLPANNRYALGKQLGQQTGIIIR